MLRIVHPARGGQGTDPPVRRKGARSAALSLTPDEVRHVRAALHNARRAFGSWACLADAMRVREHLLVMSASTAPSCMIPSGALAIRLARVTGVSVEAILTGALNAAGRCPTCGHKAGDGRAAAGGAR